MVRERLEAKSYLHSGLRITLRGRATGKREEFHHPDGIVDYLPKLVAAKGKRAMHAQLFALERESDDVRLEVALQWTEATDERDPLLRQRHPDAVGRHARDRLQAGARQGDPRLHGGQEDRRPRA